MQNETTFKEQRTAAIVPFAILCAAIVMVYVFAKITIINRPIPRQMTEAESAGQSANNEPEPPASPMEGKQVPDFDLPTLDGKRMTLSSLRGKVLFINIWATWCAPCREEMPSMENLYKQLKGPDFEMVGISIDKDGSKSVAPFVKQLGLTFPILMDPESAVAKKFQITGVPETYIVNREGLILKHVIGPTAWDKPMVSEALKELIKMRRANSGTKP